MPAALTVPTVTEADLRNYHHLHFGIAHSTDTVSTEDVEADVYDEDDQLGYYPDGVKRTLTDDQIAMFRHSEIQAILKERRHRQENADSDDHEQEPESVQEHSTGLSEGPKGCTQSRADDPPTKRKWTEFVQSSEGNPENFTHRRLARELDEVPSSSVDLLYGEDESTGSPSSNSHAQTSARVDGRTKVAYAESAHSDDMTKPLSNKAIAASKFIWPRLGAATEHS
ncbi:hypothetical protein MBLNU459_g4687t1 [Dothideomycetes sp. NU459]